MKIKRFNESFNVQDPYGEEDWGDKNYNYDGDILKFFQNLGNRELYTKVGDIIFEENLDKRMDMADEVLSMIQDQYPQYYDLVEDDVKELACVG